MNKEETRHDIVIPVGSGSIEAWLYTFKNTSQTVRPCIVMAHGYGATRDMGLDPFARRFAKAGFIVLLFDYRGTGNSVGVTRQHIDPNSQIEDYQHAITYAAAQPEIDSERIGIWGSSFSGGHALVVGATDKRVKCVVAQVPTIDGSESFRRRMTPAQADELNKSFANDRAAQFQGEPPLMRTLVSGNSADKPVYSSSDAVKWYLGMGESSAFWRNTITQQSMELFRAYKPGCYIEDISPCPLMMIVADEDTVTPSDLALNAFNRAGQPKQLITIPGGHFDPYERYFEQASQPATEWFRQHL